jgi:hypothetical protein
LAKAQIDEFLPTMQFGFQLTEDEYGLEPKGHKQVLCQMWVTPMGLTEWRPVSMVELGPQRKPSIAGYLEEDDDD